MGDALIAVLGGAAGALATAAIAFGARVRAVAAEVNRHDRLVSERDEDLASWVSDDHPRLERELSKITTEKSGEGLLYSGSHGGALSKAKERALHSYRDQERQARRFVAEVEASEGWLHDRHRKRHRKPPAELTAPPRAQKVLDRWRDKTWKVPPGVEGADIADPTRRSLDDMVEEIEKEHREAKEGGD